MRLLTLVVASTGFCACASAPSGPVAWVRPDLTAEGFATDVNVCADEAEGAGASGGGNLTVNAQSDYGRAGAGGGASATGGSNDLSPVGTAGAEVTTNMYDVAALSKYNAAVSARGQAAARQQAISGCMGARGYREVSLTQAQQDQLAAAPVGSGQWVQILRDIAEAR